MSFTAIFFQLEEGANHAIDELNHFFKWKELLCSHPGLKEGLESWAERIAEEDWLGAAKLSIDEGSILHSLKIL